MAELRDGAGCLILTDAAHEADARALEDALSVPCGRAAWRGGRGAYDAAQFAFQEQCARRSVKAVAAFGAGCLPALALAVQLPVDRLALVDATPSETGEDRRLSRFARRNLALCGAEILWAGRAEDAMWRRLLCRLPGRIACLDACDRAENGPLPKCEFSVKNAVCGFLQAGVHSKLLAENPEMCIIYG